MNTILNKKWMAWVVLILLLLNLSALATILFFTYRHNNHPPDIEMARMQTGKELISKLKLNSSQAEVFCNIRSEFFIELKPTLDNLREKRQLILNEINKDNPDTVYLKSMADTIGDIQAELKKETVRHYFRIRKICNVEQRKILSEHYTSMFMMDEPGRGPGPGMGMRYGRGRMKGQGMGPGSGKGPGYGPGCQQGKGNNQNLEKRGN